MQLSETAITAARLIDRIERLSRSGVPVHGLNPAQWDALRYLARANRFSRTPAGLAAYLGSTRGTVSQTLIALEQKGFVIRRASDRDRRSIALGLTETGAAALDDDPLLAVASDVAAATAGDAAPIVALLEGVLRAAIRRNGGRPFGVCRTCRHFRDGHGADGRGQHQCALLKEPLSEIDSSQICVEQEEA
jgi:DNA-binding MarR family transcriptional regulator